MRKSTLLLLLLLLRVDLLLLVVPYVAILCAHRCHSLNMARGVIFVDLNAMLVRLYVPPLILAVGDMAVLGSICVVGFLRSFIHTYIYLISFPSNWTAASAHNEKQVSTSAPNEEVIKGAVGLVGDLAKALGKHAAQYLAPNLVTPLLQVRKRERERARDDVDANIFLRIVNQKQIMKRGTLRGVNSSFSLCVYLQQMDMSIL